MTRDQMADDLLTIVLALGNELAPPPLPPGSDLPADVRLAEWSYVKGLASFAIMQLRDQLLEPDRSLAELARHATAAARHTNVSQTTADPRRRR